MSKREYNRKLKLEKEYQWMMSEFKAFDMYDKSHIPTLKKLIKNQ